VEGGLRILLVDIDRLKSRRNLFPNLALMKLSAYHKGRGDTVLPLNFLLAEAEVIYASCMFQENADVLQTLPLEGVRYGGSGFRNWHVVLPSDVEHICPDYSLYDCKVAMGFTSRGCCRRCPFCIVPEKEGEPKAWASIYEFWRGQEKVVLLDPNLLAAPNWRQTLEDLIREGVEVDFNQGLDIRLVTEEAARLLRKVRYGRYLRFAWDLMQTEAQVRRGLETLRRAGIPPSRCMFYMLIGFNTTYEEDLYRVRVLRGMGADVFVMAYRSNPYTRAFSSWANVPSISKIYDFGAYVAWKYHCNVEELIAESSSHEVAT